MRWSKKLSLIRTLVIFFTVIFLMPETGISQTVLKGKVVYKTDASPAAFASIELLHHKTIRTMSGNTGNFSLDIGNGLSSDTVLISSVGYQSIKLPVSIALTKSEFALSEDVKSLESVTVFKKHEVLGSTSESVGYYRSWDHTKTGGEIGRVFWLPYKKYKIDKIRFKAGNLCDTCLLRLHIREVKDGVPGEEILKDSVTLIVGKLSLDTKIPEFDISDYDLTFTQKELFVSLEVLNCKTKNDEFCAFNFAGTERGEYVYRAKAKYDWQTVNDYTIYLKLFLRY